MTEVAPAPAAPGQRDARWLAVPLLAFAFFSLTRRPPRPARSRGRRATSASSSATPCTSRPASRRWPSCSPASSSSARHGSSRSSPGRGRAGSAARTAGRVGSRSSSPCRSPITASSSSASSDPDGRVLAHSLFGCAVYGAFAAKVTIVRLHRFPKFVAADRGRRALRSAGRRLVHERGLALRAARRSPRPPIRRPRRSRRTRTRPPGRRSSGARAAAPVTRSRPPAASGQVGPNLDTLRPTFVQIEAQVEQGGGSMPSFREDAHGGPDPRCLRLRGLSCRYWAISMRSRARGRSLGHDE